MCRRLLNFLTALSLLLCVAAAALWAASHRRSAGVSSTATERRGDGGGELWVRDSFAQAWRGVLVVSDRRWLLGRRGGMMLLIAVTPGRSWLWEPAEPWPPHAWRNWRRRQPRYGFGFHRDASPAGAEWPIYEWRIATPLWAVALASGVLPAARLVSRLCRRRRGRSGLCPSCGYDLRATPDRCPECGEAT